MDLQAIQMQNFMSVKNASMSLSGQGLTLIDGVNLDNPALDNNGAGKSTIIEGVVFALFGRTLRGARGDAVVNSVINRDCTVALMMTDDNGDKYVIIRNRKHKQRKNAPMLLFTPNGADAAQDITPKSDKDFDDEVCRIIGMDYTTFVSSVVYSDSSFRFTSATDAELKQMFEKMLGIGIWGDALAETKRRIVSTNNERAVAVNDYSIAQSSIRKYEEILKSHQENADAFKKSESERLRSLASALSECRESVLNAKKALTEAKNAYNLLHDDMTVKRDIMEKAKSDMVSYDSDNERWARDYRKYQSGMSELGNMRRECDREADEARKYDVASAQAGEELQKLVQELSDAQTASLSCPYCNQPLTHEHKQKVIEEIKSRISAKETELKSSSDARDSHRHVETTMMARIQSKEAELDAMNTELAELQARLEQSSVKSAYSKANEDYMNVYTQVISSKGEVDSAEKALKIAQVKEADAQREIDAGEKPNPYSALIKDTKAAIEKLRNESEEHSKTVSRYDSVLASLKFWETAFGNSGIKSFILDSVTPFLTERANFYLSKLAGSRISVEFETQTQLKTGEMREKFAINVRNLDGGGAYALNSGGEKKRVDLAIYFALQDLVASRANKKFNVVFCDEAFDALDASGMESVISLLKEIALEKSSVFVVTHSDELKGGFSNVITVCKEDGLSTVSSV